MPDFINDSSSLSDTIGKIMANPEFLSMAASLMGNMRSSGAETQQMPEETSPSAASQEPSEENSAETEASQGSPDLGELVTTLAPVLSKMRSTGSAQKTFTKSESCGNREALLCALKPYVNENRRQAIDHIIRISQVTDLLRGSGSAQG